MMSVGVSLVHEGCLRQVRATGHAGDAPPGENLTCAAITAVLRSAAAAFRQHSAVQCMVRAPKPGDLEVTLERVAPQAREWVRGATAVLLAGCLMLAREYPSEVRLEVNEEGAENGS